ncbi:MAG: stage II sporulation protein M [Roseburia sp.]|nr:stage II sporulation protein M [Roseburia sp.]
MRKLPLLPVFLAGIFTGILIMGFGRSIFAGTTGLLDADTLYSMKNMTVDGNALFYFVLRSRVGLAVFLVAAATTYLGLFVCVGVTFWLGMSAGLFISAALLRYGMRGIFLVAAAVFPHYLLYAPAMLFLLLWCEKLCRSIYYQKSFRMQRAEEGGGLKKLFPMVGGMGFAVQLILICLALLAGCVVESYVNPYIFSGLLRIF